MNEALRKDVPGNVATNPVPENDVLAQSQRELARLSVLYALLSRVNRIIVRTEHAQELFEAVCRAATELGGFSLAWVGLLSPGGHPIQPVAWAGVASASVTEAAARIVQIETDPCPTARALRTGQSCIANQALADPDCQNWQDIAETWVLAAFAAFPLRHDGRVVGVLTLAASQPNAFGEGEQRLLAEVADDISFALGVMQREAQRIAAESQICFLTLYDEQTGLPGKAQCLTHFRALCQGPEDGNTALLIIQLRRYHAVLQALGQAAGIEMARETARRIEAFSPDVLAGRVGESKFALALSDSGDSESMARIEAFARNLRQAVAEPVHIDGEEVFLDPFVGIAVYPRDGEPEAVFEAAFVAAIFARDDSAYCRFFVADMGSGARSKLGMDAALHRALARNEFQLHYQPQVDLASGRIIGAEALLRWDWPGHGAVSPASFIPLLEENGLINAVGTWALHEACRQTRAWQDQGLPPVRMAVNLSAHQFRVGDIRATVRQALAHTGLDPQWLELELTEGVVLLDADAVIRSMKALNSDGITHALDDFGTGYSSLSYLQRLPVARIKIDRAFVTDITSNPANAAIARAILGMAQSLNMSVIAEGIETQGQLDFLRQLGCHEIQGYFFSRPLPAAAFAALLQEGRQLPTPQAPRERILLVVLDEPKLLSDLQHVLRHCDIRILATSDPNQAFDLMASHAVGVVLCDLHIPGMTGSEFLGRVKELHPHTVRIVLAAYADLNRVIDAINRSAISRFLLKPWEEEVLVHKLQEAFALFEMQHENRSLSRQLQALLAAVNEDSSR